MTPRSLAWVLGLRFMILFLALLCSFLSPSMKWGNALILLFQEPHSWGYSAGKRSWQEVGGGSSGSLCVVVNVPPSDISPSSPCVSPGVLRTGLFGMLW